MSSGSRVWAQKLIEQAALAGTIFANAIHRKTLGENEARVQRGFRRALLDAQEAERTRIARELHDQLGQSLTAMRIHAHWLRQRLEDQPLADSSTLAPRVANLMEIITDVIPDVQRICAELRPSMLDHLGLTAALEWLADEFETRTGISCDLELLPDLPVQNEHRDVALYRITQELLTNTAKHADASRVTIQFGLVDDEIRLRVQDDGHGLTAADQSKEGHFGLLGIRERAENLGGRLTVKSRPGEGATFVVRLPLSNPSIKNSLASFDI